MGPVSQNTKHRSADFKWNLARAMIKGLHSKDIYKKLTIIGAGGTLSKNSACMCCVCGGDILSKKSYKKLQLYMQ